MMWKKKINILVENPRFMLRSDKNGEYVQVDVDIVLVDNQPTIKELKEQLASTDYKVLKCYEYQLVGLELPYDIIALHAEKEILREQINQLEILNN